MCVTWFHHQRGEEFNSFLSKYCGHFHQLYLQITSLFPPSLSAVGLPPPLSEELSVAALLPMDALLVQLLPLRPFAEVVLGTDQQRSVEWQLPQCLLLVSTLGHLAPQPEETLQLWHQGSRFPEETPRLPIYQAVMNAFRLCCTERLVPVLLPGVMTKGQAQGRVSLHHHVCVHLCASVAALPPAYLPALVGKPRRSHGAREHCLLGAVLQADSQTALLATDVWCFTARYGTAELCLQHTLLIAQLMELVERFPPSRAENLPVWRHGLLRALSPDACHRLRADITALTQQALDGWRDGGYRLGQVDRVVEAHPVLQCTLRWLLSITARLVKAVDHNVISQPCPKRARQESSREEEYSRYVQMAESALKALQALGTQDTATTAPSPPPPPPQWLEAKLQELQALIAGISPGPRST
ncbi:hypothetical protein CRUP_031337 [Coryphaenoides rupestris]|nr:hypothetical protein CRUP_031337 [Coryphaenoides rupestris]